MITGDRIDVVLQGPIDRRLTPEALRSFRRNLPGCRLILSTWEGEDVSGLGFDVLVRSPDPGTHCQNTREGTELNLIRQLRGVKAGLECVRREYTCKTRTDLLLRTGKELLSFYEKHKDLPRGSAAVFSERILVCDLYTRNPRVVPMPYHASDWIAFGKTEDVQRLYSVEEPSEEDFTWYVSRKKKTWLYRNYLCRFAAEQYITYPHVRQKQGFASYHDNRRFNMINTERHLADNYLIMDHAWGWIRFAKYDPDRYHDSLWCVSWEDWKRIYERYRDGKWDLGYLVKVQLRRTSAFLILGVGSWVLDVVKGKRAVKELLRERNRKKEKNDDPFQGYLGRDPGGIGDAGDREAGPLCAEISASCGDHRIDLGGDKARGIYRLR